MPSSSASAKSTSRIEPVISDEADRAMRPYVMIGIPVTFALSFLLPLGVIYLGMLFPKNPLIAGQHSPLAILSYFIWMAPLYILIDKVYRLRLEYGRRYVEEKRWKEADAALGSFDQFGQKFFDRSGEAHYLLAFALEGLGKRAEAQRAREFVYKHRPKSEYAIKLGQYKEQMSVAASQLRKREAAPQTRAEDHASTAPLKKTRRRRF